MEVSMCSLGIQPSYPFYLLWTLRLPFYLSSFWWNSHANFQNLLSLFYLLDKRSNCTMNPSCVPRRQAQYLSPKSLSFIPFHVRNKIGNFFFTACKLQITLCLFFLFCSVAKNMKGCVLFSSASPQNTQLLSRGYYMISKKFMWGPSK